VGEKKLADYSEEFIERIVAYCQANGLPTDVAPVPVGVVPRTNRAESGPRASAIGSFQFFRQGLSVEQVAEQMGRTPATVHGYLADFIRHERISDPTRWVDADTARRVTQAARQVGTERLKPIFELLGGHVSYETIRIVVCCLEQAAN
jgi:ATP-dependent DNA helicase RecQ